MTIGTTPLTPEATWQEIDHIITFFTSLGINEVEVVYGWGCNVPTINTTSDSDHKQSIVVPLAQLVEFLHKNIAQGIYHLGEDNLSIGLYADGLYTEESVPIVAFLLCHDADIHFDATDATLEVRVRSEWESRGIRVWPQQKVTASSA